MAPTNDFRASPGGGADCLAATECGCTVSYKAPCSLQMFRGNAGEGASIPLAATVDRVRLFAGLSGAVSGRKPVQSKEWGEKSGEKAAATRLRIAQAMRRNPHVTTAALAAELGMTSTSGIEKHLKAIREAGCMRRTGPAKGGHWEVMQ